MIYQRVLRKRNEQRLARNGKSLRHKATGAFLRKLRLNYKGWCEADWYDIYELDRACLKVELIKKIRGTAE